jgi:hypothetical protein
MKKEQYTKGVTQEEVTAYNWAMGRRWIQSIIGMFASILWLPGLLIYFTSSLKLAVYLGLTVTVLLTRKYSFPRLFKETNAGQIALLENPAAGVFDFFRKFTPEPEPRVSTAGDDLGGDLASIEPLRGFFPIMPSTFAPSYFFEGVREMVDVLNEVVVSSTSLPKEDQIYYTTEKDKTKRTIVVAFQLTVSVLQNIKWSANVVRYDKATRDKTVREQVVSYVIPELRRWIAGKAYDEINVDEIRRWFLDVFSGAKLHFLEKKLGYWTGEPQLISFVLAPDLQKIQELLSAIKSAQKIAESMWLEDKSVPLAIHFQNVAEAAGLKTGKSMREIRFSGEAELVKRLRLETNEDGGN